MWNFIKGLFNFEDIERKTKEIVSDIENNN